MYEQKLTRTLAVSNFSPAQLDCILKDKETKVKPVVNQLPYSVAYHPPLDVKANRERGVLVQAWAPLGGSLGGRFDRRIKSKCADIGRTYNKSFAQVALRWLVQQGIAFTTQSRIKEHFAEDLDIFDFTLTDAEMSLLGSLAENR
jgi:diketogulonate reductase-like aldo/keto reductase